MAESAPKETAKYGDWESPISQDLVTSGSKSLSEPRVSANGRIFFLESRTDGSRTIIEVTAGGGEVRDILPASYSASNSVYTYGGSAYAALSDGRLVFSNSDSSVNALDPDTGAVKRLTGDPVLRYSNFSANHVNSWVLAIQEDHTIDHPTGVVNRIVAIHADSGEVKTVLERADFYYPPEYSDDGTKFAWLEWDHPDQPWYAARLYYAAIDDDAKPGSHHLVAGGLLHGVAEPRWGPDGSLFFGMELTNYRQLFRLRPDEKNAQQVTSSPDLAEAEFAELYWRPGR
jgi:outer membrane protein assembly factor BamB